MAQILPILKSFGKDQHGSIALLLVFSFSLVFGSVALAIDVARFFSLQSRLEFAAQGAALLAARNRDVLTAEEIERLARQYAQLELEGSAFPSLQTTAVKLMNFDLVRSEGGAEFRVTLGAVLSTTLMRAFNFFDDIEITSKATAQSRLESMEIAMIVDRAETVQLAGKLSAVKLAGSDFITLVDRLATDLERSVAVGVVPMGSQLMNIAPYKDWVSSEDWPTIYPPTVPGHVDWVGLLENQRWCVSPRASGVGKTVPPIQQKFPLVLDIGKIPGVLPEEDHYFIATSEDCDQAALKPLDQDFALFGTYVSGLKSHGQGAGGTAMLWAERMLSPDWRQAWALGNGVPADFGGPIRKVIVLINGSNNLGSTEENQQFLDSCHRLKMTGARLYIADFASLPEAVPLLKDCVSRSGGYFPATDSEQLSGALKDIAKSLLTVRLIDFN